jgi:predicted outer membrane protein
MVLGLGATGCMAGTAGAGMSPALTQQASAMHHFAMAVHMGETEEAQLALTKTQNPQVRAYAQKMVADHTMGMQMEERMTMSMHMGENHGPSNGSMASGGEMHMDMAAMRAELAANPASRPVVEDHMRAMQMLQAMNGAQFDRAYMDRQVVAHRYTLEQMDRMMGEMHTAMGMSGSSSQGAMAGSSGSHAGHAGMSAGGSGSMNPGAITMGTREGMMAMHMQEREMVAMHLQQAQQIVASMR